MMSGQNYVVTIYEIMKNSNTVTSKNSH